MKSCGNTSNKNNGIIFYSTAEATDKINVQEVVPSSGLSACSNSDKM